VGSTPVATTPSVPTSAAESAPQLLGGVQTRKKAWASIIIETLCVSVGFDVLTAVNTKMAVFWVVAPCSLVEVYEVLDASNIRAMIALMMETERTSETLVNFYQTTWRYNPEDSHLLCTCSSRSSLSEDHLESPSISVVFSATIGPEVPLLEHCCPTMGRGNCLNTLLRNNDIGLR
jgi:hypothetical protein